MQAVGGSSRPNTTAKRASCSAEPPGSPAAAAANAPGNASSTTLSAQAKRTIPNSSTAYTRSAVRPAATRWKAQPPSAMPPMKPATAALSASALRPNVSVSRRVHATW